MSTEAVETTGVSIAVAPCRPSSSTADTTHTDEVSYDVPWEYVSSAARYRQSASVSQQQKQAYRDQPPCGVAARRIKQSTSSTELPVVTGKSTDTEGSTTPEVWQYRGPDIDQRPQCEYDAPWDSKVRDRLSLKELNSAEPSFRAALADQQQQQRPSSVVYGKLWEAESGTNVHSPQTHRTLSSFITSLKPSGSTSNATLTATAKSHNSKHSPHEHDRVSVMERVGLFSPKDRQLKVHSTSSINPASSSPKEVRCWPLKQHRCGATTHKNDECRQKNTTDSSSGNSKLSSAGSGSPRSSSSDGLAGNSSSTLRRTPGACIANGTPRIETVFWCKTPDPVPSADSPHELKNRLIQQVCAGNSPANPTNGMVDVSDDGSHRRQQRKAAQRQRKPSADSVVRSRHNHQRLNSRQRQQSHGNGRGTAPLAAINGATVDRQLQRPSTDQQSSKCGLHEEMCRQLNGDTAQTALEEEQYDIPWEFCNRKKINRLIEQKKTAKKTGYVPISDVVQSNGTEHTVVEPPVPMIPKLDLMKLDRNQLSLNFGCAGLNPAAEKFDVTIPLEKQPWFHGNITRNEAELRLANSTEGSFLVRLCESNKGESALSLKSAKGFMHMKIQWNEERCGWILGYFSQPFDCVPRMIRYYSINKLPIKGAEHMCLLKAVHDRLL